LKFSYSVDGSLDEDEQKALESLFSDANKLAESFYSGNVEEAFAQAGKMQFNTNEIASFSLKMSQQEAYAKTEAYQKVQNQSETEDNAAKNSTNPNELFRKIGKFLFDAAEFMQKHADQANHKEQAKALLKQLPAQDEIKNKWEDFLAGAFKELGYTDF
ncbi:MAG TPA: hypothetical protein VFM46_12290, partial [Pseudomonadales bacterium]|nr:hypothetical protein [Pseudomonadales bacterium]